MRYSINDALRDIKRRIALWREKARELCSSSGRVLVFGAGSYGSFLVNHILPEGGAKGIIDNNRDLRGQTIGGLTIAPVEEYAARHPGACVFITVANKTAVKAIKAQCTANGLRPMDFCPESLSSGLPPFGGKQINLWLSALDNPSFDRDADGSDCAPLDDFIGTGCLVSYADAGEDAVFLEYLHPVKQGFYIDVGCADPELCSVTKLFYDLGWHGINIDPRASEMAKYPALRPRDVNLTLGVSDAEGELPFWVGGSLSTFNRKQTEAWRGHPLFGTTEFVETRVPVTTLNAVLDQYFFEETIHFLKIDAETHEKRILDGLDLARCRPWMIMVEGEAGAVQEHLADNGYALLRNRCGNCFYASREKKEELVNNCLTKPVFFLLRREQAEMAREALAALAGDRSSGLLFGE